MRYEALAVLTIGDPRLEQVAGAVCPGDAGLIRDIGQMHATLNEFRRRHGYGRAIAAPQVGIGKRFIAMNLGEGPLALLNPEITWRSNDLFRSMGRLPEHTGPDRSCQEAPEHFDSLLGRRMA